MRRPLVGAIAGAALGALASLGIGGCMMFANFTLVTLPGSLLLGSLLGWAVGRLGKNRFPIAIGLAFAATACNAPLSGVFDWMMGDPIGLGSDGHSLRGCIGIGILGVMLLWWVMVFVSVAVAGLLVLATHWARPAKA